MITQILFGLALGLAGYLAVRVTPELIDRLEGPLSRLIGERPPSVDLPGKDPAR